MRFLAIAPTRISFFGGSTDLEPYCSQFGGAVINMAINLRQHTTLYSGDDIWGAQNSFPLNATPDFYYKLLEKYKINGGHHSKIISTFDGFIMSGLGSSGAAGVALVGAINKRLGLGLTRDEIALTAWQHEIDLGIYTGKQDQFASVYGGLNYMSFTDKVEVVKINVPNYDKLLSWMVLFYIGGGKKDNKLQKNFERLDRKRLRALDTLKYITGLALPLFLIGKYQEIGELLDISWQYKKESNRVTTARIDGIYDLAKSEGAIGGKICGSGGVGYMVFMCPPEKKDNLIRKMRAFHIEQVDFGVDFGGLEARIL